MVIFSPVEYTGNMADRDDAQLRQFKARAQQPKLMQPKTGATAPVNVFVVYDSDFGRVSDQYDSTRFKYTGTSPGLTKFESMRSRRDQHTSMESAFRW